MTWQVSFKTDLRDQDNLWVFLSSWWRRVVRNLNTVSAYSYTWKKSMQEKSSACLIWDERRINSLNWDCYKFLPNFKQACSSDAGMWAESVNQKDGRWIRWYPKSEETLISMLQNNRVLEYRVHSFQKTYSKPVGSSSYLAMLVPLTTKAKMEMEIILQTLQQQGCTCLKQWSSFMGEV